MAVATLRVPHATAVSGRPGQMDRSCHADRVWGKAKRIARPCASLAANGPPYAYRRVGVNAAVPPYRPRSRLPYDGRWFPAFYSMRGKRAIRKEYGWT